MTGFRIGWLEAPPELGSVIENLVQYTTSGVPVFIQRAATAAVEQGEAFLAWQIERCRRSRDILCEGLAKTGRVQLLQAGGSVLSLLLDRRLFRFEGAGA